MITLQNPINVPAQQAQVADSLWITNLSVFAPSSSGKVKVIATLCPMVSSNGNLLSDKSKKLTIDDVLTLAQTNSEVAAAMTALFAAVQNQVVTQKLF